MIDMFNAKNIVRLAQVDSTNEYAKKLAKEGARHGTVVLADMQTAGKGRLGRSFASPDGKGIFMSVLLRPDIEPVAAGRLTLVAAVAVNSALKNICNIECGIKWPNDIVADGKKVSGILTEMSTENGRIKYVIIGIGINVGNESFADELSDVATSVKMLTGKIYDRDDIVTELLKQLEGYYQAYIASGSLAGIKAEYDKSLVNADKKVKVINGDNVLQGICRGIDDDGNLLVETETGIERIISGEVSVRGVYGYV